MFYPLCFQAPTYSIAVTYEMSQMQLVIGKYFIVQTWLDNWNLCGLRQALLLIPSCFYISLNASLFM